MIDIDAATLLGAGFCAGALPSLLLLILFISERRELRVTEKSLHIEQLKATRAETQNAADERTIRDLRSEREVDRDSIKSLRDENKQLHGDDKTVVAQVATIETLRDQREQDCRTVREMKEEIVERKSEVARLNKELQAEMGKKFSVRNFNGDVETGRILKRQKRVELFVVLHDKHVVAVQGDMAYREHMNIPPKMLSLIAEFLSASGAIPPLPGLKLVKAA